MADSRTFDTQSANVVKVIAVYVRVYAEQPTHNRAHGVSEIPWEGNP
jgi:hypothetical protein